MKVCFHPALLRLILRLYEEDFRCTHIVRVTECTNIERKCKILIWSHDGSGFSNRAKISELLGFHVICVLNDLMKSWDLILVSGLCSNYVIKNICFTCLQVYYNKAAVKQIDVPSFSGAFGILPNHVPTLAVLKPGVLSVLENDNSIKKFFVSSGSITVNDDSSG